MIKLVPISDAAEAVGVSRVTLFKYVSRGLLKRYRRPGLDRRTYVDLEVLRMLLKPINETDEGDDLTPIEEAPNV